MADVFTGFFDFKDLYTFALAAGVFDGHDGIGAGGYGGASHNAAALPRADLLLRYGAGRDVFDDCKGYGCVGAGLGHVLVTHRVAVHRRVVVGRVVALGEDIAG